MVIAELTLATYSEINLGLIKSQTKENIMETERDENHNVKLKDGFDVVMVWPGTILDDTTPEQFEIEMADMFKDWKVEFQHLETIQTFPDKDREGNAVPNTGNRSDLFFAVKVPKEGSGFFVNRLSYGIRLLEDAISSINNPNGIVYPSRVTKYPH